MPGSVRDVIIRPFPIGTDIINENWVVQDGIVVIPKNMVHSLNGTKIEPSSLIQVRRFCQFRLLEINVLMNNIAPPG